MKRFRLLFLGTLGVVILMASAGASVASASGISFDEYPVTVSGAAPNHQFEFSGGRSLLCSSKLSAAATRPAEALPTTVTLDNCSSAFEGKVTVKMNGCSFIYHPAIGAGSFDIGPSGCGAVTMEGEYCTRSFPAQTGLTATFENEGTGSGAAVKVRDEANNLKFTVTKGSTFYCGALEDTAGYRGTWTVTAQNGGPVGAHVEAGTGVFMTGEASGEEAKQPKFSSEQYPVYLLGAQDLADKQILTLEGGRKVECADVNSYSEMSKATSQLSLNEEYRSCTALILGAVVPAVVHTNSCHRVIHALNSGPPYAGALDIACAKEGDGMQIDVYDEPGAPETEEHRVCSYQFAPQSGISGISLSNAGSGSSRSISVGFSLSGLAYSRTKGTTVKCGHAASTATSSGTSILRGLK